MPPQLEDDEITPPYGNDALDNLLGEEATQVGNELGQAAKVISALATLQKNPQWPAAVRTLLEECDMAIIEIAQKNFDKDAKQFCVDAIIKELQSSSFYLEAVEKVEANLKQEFISEFSSLLEKINQELKPAHSPRLPIPEAASGIPPQATTLETAAVSVPKSAENKTPPSRLPLAAGIAAGMTAIGITIATLLSSNADTPPEADGTIPPDHKVVTVPPAQPAPAATATASGTTTMTTAAPATTAPTPPSSLQPQPTSIPKIVESTSKRKPLPPPTKNPPGRDLGY